MEVQVEMEAIPTDTPVLRRATEVLERGAELLAEHQQDISRIHRALRSALPTCCVHRPNEG